MNSASLANRRGAIWALPLAVLLAAAGLMVSDLGGIASRLAAMQFDSYQYLRPRPYEDPGPKTTLTVRTLQIDSASIAKFGPWPWPTATLAKLTDELKAQGAAIVVFAFPLDKQDAASPQQLAASLPPGPGTDLARTALARLPSPDDALVHAMGQLRTVTGFALRPTQGGLDPGPQTEITIDGPESASNALREYDFASAALPRIEKASAGIGALNLSPDADGKLRAIPMAYRWKDKIVPSLEAETMRLAAGQPAITLRAQSGGLPVIDGGTRFSAIKSGLIDVPLRKDGALAVYFSGPRSEREISPAALDAGTLGAGTLKNAIVYIASPDSVFETPAGPRSEAEIRAEAMENILLGTALKVPAGLTAQLILLAVTGIGLIFLFVRFGALWAGLFAGAVIFAIQAFTWDMFASTQVLLDSTTPSFALGFAFLAGLAARSVEFLRARTELRSAFADALAPSALDKIARQPALLKLDGETRNVTYLSCGVRDYAELSESFRDDAAGFTRMMRSALMPLVKEVFGQGGTIDHYSGEGFTAFWNAPLDDGEHAIHACEAANRMTIALARVNEQLAGERRLDGTAFKPIEIGIAVTTGPAIAGGFGDSGRMAYSVTGDCTALAESIRALSQQYGPAVIVSDDTRKAAERGFAFLEVDYLVIGSRAEPVKLYAMLGNPLMRASPKFRAMATFHEHIFNSLHTQQWEKTRELIDQCRKLSGASQKMYDLHLKRVEYFETNPPGADWDGAFRPVLK
ncbi:MAG: adenylate/guanylate cyclase domain-containing protein [Proteobacteria bacterium]|nr:adenylate/guanylate cyclase domain-containing protein [Pseudomonadota bacterium]